MLVYSQNGPESRLGSVYIYLYPYLFQYVMMMPRNLYFGVITFWGLPVSCICTSRGVAKGGAFKIFYYGRRVKMGELKRKKIQKEHFVFYSDDFCGTLPAHNNVCAMHCELLKYCPPSKSQPAYIYI